MWSKRFYNYLSSPSTSPPHSFKNPPLHPSHLLDLARGGCDVKSYFLKSLGHLFLSGHGIVLLGAQLRQLRLKPGLHLVQSLCQALQP